MQLYVFQKVWKIALLTHFFIGFQLILIDAIPDPYYRHHPYQNRWNQQPTPFYKKIKTENIYSVKYKKPYLTMLWNQTQNLPPEAFKMLEEKYREAGFFIEVRLQVNN